MIKETVIPEPTREEVWRIYKQKIEQNQITIAVAASILQSFWYFCDYILLPQDRLYFFLWRISVLMIPIAVCAFRKQLRISPSACLFFSGTLTAWMISLVMCSAPESVFQTYVVGYCLLFLAAGALANLETIHSILFPIFSLIFNIVLYAFISTLDPGIFITEALVPIYSCATISYLMIEGRKKMQLKEIRSRMEIDRSRKMIEAQKNKLNEELDNFVYSVSHDLRSPLLSVKGIISLILTTEEPNKSTVNYLRMAQGSIDRLDNTIQDILEYSRNSRLDVKPEWFDMELVVKQVFDDIQFIAENPIQFEIAIEGEAEIYSDRSRVTTIIKNLASNAAKYRKLDISNCMVRFRMRREDDRVCIELSDNGIGIPSNHLENVFKMFYRVSTDRVGTGLGLFIVDEITRKLKGTISIHSTVDIGTTITIQLPDIKGT